MCVCQSLTRNFGGVMFVEIRQGINVCAKTDQIIVSVKVFIIKEFFLHSIAHSPKIPLKTQISYDEIIQDYYTQSTKGQGSPMQIITIKTFY